METPSTRQLAGYGWTGDLPLTPLNKDELHLLAQITGTTGKTLDDLARERDLTLLAEGGEHKVYMQQKDPSNVVKLAYKGTGWTFEYKETPDGEGKIALRRASVRDYVKRLYRINKEFDKTTKIIGVYENPATGNSLIAHTQVYLDTHEPTQAEIDVEMGERGFRQLNPNIITSSAANATYYNPDTNLIVGDCYPRNFRKFNGRPYPIDIVAQRPEGRFKELAMANMLPENRAHQMSLDLGKTDFPGVDEFLEKLQVAKAQGEARGNVSDATAVALVKGMEGRDTTKVPLLHVAREFLHGRANEESVRLEAEKHFKKVARLKDAGIDLSRTTSRTKTTDCGHG